MGLGTRPRDYPPSTVVRWVQSWWRRIWGVGVVWDCGGTSAGVGPLLGGKQGFYGVRGLVTRRELCRSSSAALQNPGGNKERTYPKPLHNRRCCVVVLGIVVGGKWSKEASNFIRMMADALHSTQFDRRWPASRPPARQRKAWTGPTPSPPG